jgi:hypothetical protein
MATPVNPEAQALIDLQSAVTAITAAVAAEITALQNAINAQGVNNSPAIEASVANLRSLIGTLNASVAPPTVAGPPVVTSISPNAGPIAGGTVVTLAGTGFTGATGVTVGGVAATGLTVASDTSLTFTTPPSAAGLANVVVTTPAGVSGLATTTFTFS